MKEIYLVVKQTVTSSKHKTSVIAAFTTKGLATEELEAWERQLMCENYTYVKGTNTSIHFAKENETIYLKIKKQTVIK